MRNVIERKSVVINWIKKYMAPGIMERTGASYEHFMAQSLLLQDVPALARNCIHYGQPCRDRRLEISVLPSCVQPPRRLLKMASARPLPALRRLRPWQRGRCSGTSRIRLLPDYEASVGTFIKMLQGHWGHEMSAPAKVAQVILQLASKEQLPAHLLLGSDAVQYARFAEEKRESDARHGTTSASQPTRKMYKGCPI